MDIFLGYGPMTSTLASLSSVPGLSGQLPGTKDVLTSGSLWLGVSRSSIGAYFNGFICAASILRMSYNSGSQPSYRCDPLIQFLMLW